MKTLLMGTVAALFAFSAANADEDVVVVIDTDADGVVTMQEYEAAFAEPSEDFWFDAFDTDRDAVLTRDEVVQGMWTHYDVTGDNTWSPDELKAWEDDQLRYQATRSGREVSK